MSSPTTTPRRTPKRTTPKRTPLQERSLSEKNETAGRVTKDGRAELADTDIFAATPFPTKPQHVLLPSTVKKQRSKQNVENELPSFFARAQPATTPRPQAADQKSQQRQRRAPNLQLKRSVTALRDIYEAQAERSRPTTATLSPPLRPTTAGSRTRSVSSSDGLSGRNAWERLGLPRVSSDDMAMLPALTELDIRQLHAQSSFAERMQSQAVSSSPNYRVYNVSSPTIPVYQDGTSSSDPVEQSSPIIQAYATSSPNFLRLANSSSMILTDPTPQSILEEEEQPTSSPNIVKLGTSSPKRTSSPTPSQASTCSRKRKRFNFHEPFAGRTPLVVQTAGFSSSPPIEIGPRSSDTSVPSSEPRILPSSPPEIATARSHSLPSSSPVFRVPEGRLSSDTQSVTSAHTNLQTALSSSPGPQIQYPIVRAPRADQFSNLNVNKRQTSREQYLVRVPTNPVRRLSPVPSVALMETLRSEGTAYDQGDDMLDESLHSEDLLPAQVYMMENDRNGSRDHIISESDRHEAADELSELPNEAYVQPPPAFLGRSSIFMGASTSGNGSSSRLNSMRTSMDTRLSSMRSRSFRHGRSDSSRSNSFRPGSSSSQMSSMAVPTWARKYYSGIYQNSFQYLYNSSQNLATASIPPPSAHSPPAPSLRHSSTTSKRGRFSIESVRQTMSHFSNLMPAIKIPKDETRPDVRKSHFTMGSGPLVSNPVRPTSAFLRMTPTSHNSQMASIRRVSEPLSAIDPRAHWAGVTGESDGEEATDPRGAAYTQLTNGNTYPHSSPLPVYLHRKARHSFRLPSPHLHHDRRLGTGSSASAGFGAPYNRRSRWFPSDVFAPHDTSRSLFQVNLASLQVVCFVSGFLLPFMWFIGAVLPLPHRPTGYHDIEKVEAEARAAAAGGGPSLTEWEEMDIVGRLRLERHVRGLDELRWQNARWWKRMNIFMSFVGAIVIIVIVVLAVIGTKSHW